MILLSYLPDCGMVTLDCEPAIITRTAGIIEAAEFEALCGFPCSAMTQDVSQESDRRCSVPASTGVG